MKKIWQGKEEKSKRMKEQTKSNSDVLVCIPLWNKQSDHFGSYYGSLKIKTTTHWLKIEDNLKEKPISFFILIKLLII